MITADLRDAGFLVTPVPTLDGARRALAQRGRAPFSLVVLDIMLPDGDGIDLLREIRADAAHAFLPVIILSHAANLPARLRGLGVGADDFVGKPHSRNYLIQRARKLCGLPEGPTAAHRSRRVLLVDSDTALRDSIARLLRVGHDCDVVTLDGPEQARQYLEVEDVTLDCVVVERKSFLPLRDALRAGRIRVRVPVVILDDGPAPVNARPVPVGGITIVPRSLGAAAVAEAALHDPGPPSRDLAPRLAPRAAGA